MDEARAAAGAPEARPEPGSAPTSPTGSDASVRSAEDSRLRVALQDLQGLSVEVVTLQCAGDCVELRAIAHGGNAPYVFRWDDGSSEPQRRLCPTTSTELAVSVTDSALITPEFRYEAQTARVTVPARVIGCAADSGILDAGGVNAEMPTIDAATLDCAPIALTPTRKTCPNLAGELSIPLDHLMLRAKHPGALQARGSFSGGPPIKWQVWGSSDGCSLDELLATIEPPQGNFDIEQCFTPKRASAYAVLLVHEASPTLTITTWTLSACNGCSH